MAERLFGGLGNLNFIINTSWPLQGKWRESKPSAAGGLCNISRFYLYVFVFGGSSIHTVHLDLGNVVCGLTPATSSRPQYHKQLGSWHPRHFWEKTSYLGGLNERGRWNFITPIYLIRSLFIFMFVTVCNVPFPIFYGAVHRVTMKNIVCERECGSNSTAGLGEGSL